jgi:hypothetical protein
MSLGSAIARAPRSAGAGDDQIGLIPSVGAIHGNDPGLDNHAAGGLQPIADVASEVGDDRAVRLDRRRHGARAPVDQLVTGVGAVVPFQELGKTHALRCRLSHAQRIDVAGIQANRFEHRGARPAATTAFVSAGRWRSPWCAPEHAEPGTELDTAILDARHRVTVIPESPRPGE